MPNPVETICDVCGKTFLALPPKKGVTDSQAFCSEDCVVVYAMMRDKRPIPEAY